MHVSDEYQNWKNKKKKKEPLFNLVKGGEEICTDKKKWNITGDFV